MARVIRGLEWHRELDWPLEAMWSKWLMSQKGKLGLEEKGALLDILQLVG